MAVGWPQIGRGGQGSKHMCPFWENIDGLPWLIEPGKPGIQTPLFFNQINQKERLCTLQGV